MPDVGRLVAVHGVASRRRTIPSLINIAPASIEFMYYWYIQYYYLVIYYM